MGRAVAVMVVVELVVAWGRGGRKGRRVTGGWDGLTCSVVGSRDGVEG